MQGLVILQLFPIAPGPYWELLLKLASSKNGPDVCQPAKVELAWGLRAKWLIFKPILVGSQTHSF